MEHLNRIQADHSTAGVVKNRLAKSESLYQNDFSPWAKSNGWQPWWWYFQPAFNCPHEVERIGRINDGGKWVSGMSVLERPSAKKRVIYSLGVFDDSSFEATMLERTNCNPRIHFSKVFLGGKDKVENGHVYKTLPTIMKENGRTWIDGKILPFSQLQVELHLNSADIGTDFAAFTRFKAWFERLEKFHLRPFWSELNLVPTWVNPTVLPGYVEYSFINVAGDHSLDD
ncbi:hypothetical protein BGZ81_006372 [Podila clonocystis]|nr:hypothetical protein BGZ81_006372 [Podila clonocystis]